jgi:hypothetical protein
MRVARALRNTCPFLRWMLISCLLVTPIVSPASVSAQSSAFAQCPQVDEPRNSAIRTTQRQTYFSSGATRLYGEVSLSGTYSLNHPWDRWTAVNIDVEIYLRGSYGDIIWQEPADVSGSRLREGDSIRYEKLIPPDVAWEVWGDSVSCDWEGECSGRVNETR